MNDTKTLADERVPSFSPDGPVAGLLFQLNHEL